MSRRVADCCGCLIELFDEPIDERYSSQRVLRARNHALCDHLQVPRQNVWLVNGIDAPDLGFEVDDLCQSTIEFRSEQ